MLVLIVYKKWPPNDRHKAMSFGNHFIRAAKVIIIFQTEIENPIKKLFLHPLPALGLAPVLDHFSDIDSRRQPEQYFSRVVVTLTAATLRNHPEPE